MQKIGNDSDALLGRLADVVLVWLLLAMVPVKAVTAATTAFFLMPALMRRPWRSMAEYFRRMMVASHSLWSSQRASSLNRLPPWLQEAPTVASEPRPSLQSPGCRFQWHGEEGADVNGVESCSAGCRNGKRI
jgi:hypothetical protein